MESATKVGQGGMIGADVPAGSVDLATIPVEERSLRGLSIAEALFSSAEREQVAALLTVPKDSPALMPFLALCVAEGFSPWAGHVWLIPKTVKVPSANGDGEVEEKKHIPMVGRDGLLHKARQSMTSQSIGSFRGLRANVVCARDTFEVEDDGENVRVLHRFAHKPTEFAPTEAPDRYRGPVIGAWARLKQEGLPPTFYFASVREHGKLRHTWAWNAAANGRRPLYFDPAGGVTFAEFTKVARADGSEQVNQNRPVQEWEGAWDYLSSMILKAAQSYVLRIGLGVTGFVPADELRSVAEWQETPMRGGAAPVSEAEALTSFDFAALDIDDELRERLERGVEESNAAEAFSWGPAKCEMVFTGRSPADLAAVADDIERENALRRERMDPADPEEAEVVVPAEKVTEERVHAERAEMLRERASALRAHIEAADQAGEECGESVSELEQVTAELAMLGDAGESQE